MKKVTGILILLGIIIIIVVQLATNKTIAENRVYIYDKENQIPVFAEVVDNKSHKTNKSYSGVFEALNEVKISSETQGVIEKVFVREGDNVKKGEPLVKIDDQMLRLSLEVLETKIDGLRKDEERYLKLTENEAVPGIKLEKAQNALETLEAEKQAILEQINKTTVRAPFDGIISMKFCETGQFAAPAMPLMELVNTSQLKLVVHINEQDLSYFNQETNYHVVPDADIQTPIKAELWQISEKGGIGNSFKIEFLINQSQINLKPKMFGTLVFETQNNDDRAVQIPSRAILGSQTHPEVYLIKNGKAKRTPIVISRRNADLLTVKDGIKSGDSLITGGFINLFDDANVIVKK